MAPPDPRGRTHRVVPGESVLACPARQLESILVRCGPVVDEPALAETNWSRQVLIRSTPPRWEGCRSASRSLSLKLMTFQSM